MNPNASELCREADRRVRLHESNAKAFSLAGEALAILAFLTFCVLLYVTLNIGPVL